MGYVVIDFISLRENQATIIAEAARISIELEAYRESEGDELVHLQEARLLTRTLGLTARNFLDERLVELKDIALRQCQDANDDKLWAITVRRVSNALHASVVPIDALIRRLGESLREWQLATLLRSGMIAVLPAVDGIGNELRLAFSADGEAEGGRLDFGVYDPGTD